MSKIYLKELPKSDQDFIKKRVRTLFHSVWIEEDIHLDEESGLELTSGYYQVFTTMKPWVKMFYFLTLPFLSFFRAIKVGAEEFMDNLKSSSVQPSMVFKYRNEEFKDN